MVDIVPFLEERNAPVMFQPKDEMSLRHLFSTDYAREKLGLSYVGPVLSAAGKIEDSPDCIILDRRKPSFRTLRCEFKFVPQGKEDFITNGTFDVAVVWDLPKGQTKDGLLKSLLVQNGCAELIVLKEQKAFWDLPIYAPDSLSKLDRVGVVRELIMRRGMKPPTVFALCIAARIYPAKFSLEQMIEFLRKRFPEVERMQAKGRANVVTAALQSQPQVLQKMMANKYRWTNEIDNEVGATELTALLNENDEQVPSVEDLKEFAE